MKQAPVTGPNKRDPGWGTGAATRDEREGTDLVSTSIPERTAAGVKKRRSRYQPVRASA
jgi:hypothetical protein